jgi:DMSO reductase anchor subunit
VALFTAFSAASCGYAVAWLIGAGWPTLAVGLLTVTVGAAGVFASGRLYLVPARPAWNSPRTIVSFYASVVAGGPVVTLLVVTGATVPPGAVRVLLAVAAAGTIIQLATYQHLAVSVVARREREYRGTARLLFRRFSGRFALRIAAGIGAVVLLVAAVCSRPGGPMMTGLSVGALACVAVGELIGRWLFYVTVVPMTTAGTYFPGRS